MADDTTPAETTAIFAELNETLRQVQESMTAIAGAVNQNVTLSEKERAERQKLIDQAKNDDSLKRTNDLLKEYGVTLEKVTNGDKQRVDVVKQTIDEEKAARNQLLQTLIEEGVIRADASEAEKEELLTKLELNKLELKRKKIYEDQIKQLGFMFDQNGKIVKQTKLLTDEQEKEIAALKKKKEAEDKLKQATEDVKESLSNLGKDLLKLGLTTAFDFLKASIVGTYKAQVAYEDALLDGQTGYSVQAAAISAKMEEMAGAMDNLGGGLVSMGGQLAATGLQVAMLGGPIGLLAIAIGALLAVFGYAAKVEAENMKRTAELKKKQAALLDELFKDFGALGDASMASSRGMTGLKDDLAKVGLTIKEFEKLNTVLKANAKEMSMLGAGTIGGMKNFLDVSAGLIKSELGKTFREMGIDREDMMEHTAKYMAQEQRFGLMQKKSIEDQAKAAGAYVVELDKMATLTGATRKEQETAREAVMQIQSLRAAMMKAKASGNTEEAERLKRYLDVATAFQAQGLNEQAKGTAELAAGKGPISEASAMMIQAAPQMIDMLDKNIGTAVERYATGIKEIYTRAVEYADTAAVGGDLSKLVGDYGKIDDSNTKLDQLIELQKKNPEKSLDQLLVSMRKNEDPATKARVEQEEANRTAAIDTQERLLNGQELASQEMTEAGGWLKEAAEWLNNAAHDLQDWAMGVWERSGGEALFKKAWGSFVDALEPLKVVIQPLIDTITWLTEGAIKGLGWSLDFISQGLKIVAQLLTGDISGAFKTWYNGMKFALEGLWGTFVWFKDGLMSAGKAIASWAENFAKGIETAFSNLIDGIMSILPSWAKPSTPATAPAPAPAAKPPAATTPAQTSSPASKRAKGGIVPGSAEGTVVTVGEAGKPEAILPLDVLYQQNAALIKAVNATTESVDKLNDTVSEKLTTLTKVSSKKESAASQTAPASQNANLNKKIKQLEEAVDTAAMGYIKISPPDKFANPENTRAAARIQRQGASSLGSFDAGSGEDWENKTPENDRAGARIKRQGAPKLAEGGGGAAPVAAGGKGARSSSGVTAPDGSNVDITSLFSFGGLTGQKSNFDDLEPEFKSRIVRAAQDFMAAGGSKINLASAHRSPEDQERIYKTWKDAGGDLKTKPTAGGMTTPALPPSLGGSPNAHQLGVAIDAGQQAAEINSKIKLSDYGLRWGGTFSNPDPVHIQMANFVPGKNAEPVKAFDGGVFSPKPGGVHVNLAEAGLREAAVPLNPGEKIRIEKSEQDNATPKKDPLSTVMASDIPTNSNQAAEILAALHDLMESKFDTMISALRDGNDITDKLLKYSQV